MVFASVDNYNFFILQIYTDFDEIRQEIVNETERVSGNNKVRYQNAGIAPYAFCSEELDLQYQVWITPAV